MIDDDTCKRVAEEQFKYLKLMLQDLEARGFRPQLLIHGNGMPDSLRIDEAYPTTPQVEEIRVKRVHSA